MNSAEAEAIIKAVKFIVGKIAPDARYIEKYGGEVIAPNPEEDAFVGGIFTYKDHVNLEFSNGASFDDKNGHLEGKGKKRRHLKFEAEGDVMAKDTEHYLKQVLAD